MFTGDTATNLVDPEFQKLLKNKKFSNDLYNNVHSYKNEFTIENDGIKHKYRKLRVW